MAHIKELFLAALARQWRLSRTRAPGNAKLNLSGNTTCRTPELQGHAVFLVRNSGKSAGPIYNWLVEHKAAIRDGTASLDGTEVNEGTLLRQYEYTVSLLVITLQVSTPHLLPTQTNRYLRFAPWKYSMLSLLFGPWCFPWGPFYTVKSIITNLTGGKRRNAGSLLALLEWGYDLPSDVEAEELHRELLTLDASALSDIETRRKAGNYDTGIAIRVLPTNWADAECEVQFDFPVSDGRDWIARTSGLTILVDKKYTDELAGRTLVFKDGKFVLES